MSRIGGCAPLERATPPSAAFLDRSPSAIACQPAVRALDGKSLRRREYTHDWEASETLTLGRWRSSVSRWLCSVNLLSLSSCIAGGTQPTREHDGQRTRSPRLSQVEGYCTYTACADGTTC
jgi:hypothetical protein